MSRKDRTNYSAEEKVAILRRHLLDQVPVSELCDQYKLHPTVFYRWQKQFFENGAAAFNNSGDKTSKGAEQRVEFLEKKLAYKNEVLAELMEEHHQVKKRTWGDLRRRWVEPYTRDAIVDFIHHWHERAEMTLMQMVLWIGLPIF